MTFLSHSADRARSPNRRLRDKFVQDAAATLCFVLAVGFAAALVFGFLGH
ncbi:hypothetical protein MesoLjLc_11790 [Mesorhizobium sp. L-8-10]|nr:hypothetical protein [Mesorhizobium sp. L-8-10]BCH29249.1 hypothetical protein MesoLjLc_11790 [Mesorhizobium sp. L-8-10]